MSLLLSAWPPVPRRTQMCFPTALVLSPRSSSSQHKCSEDVAMDVQTGQIRGYHHFCVSRTPSNPELQILCCLLHLSGPQQVTQLLDKSSTWKTHTNEPIDSSSWSKLTEFQTDKLATWLVNYIHFLLLHFQALFHSLFLHLVWLLSLEVKQQWLCKSFSERVRNAHVKKS